MPALAAPSPPRRARFRTLPIALRIGVVVATALLTLVAAPMTAASGRLYGPDQADPGQAVMITGVGLANGQSGSLTFNGVAVGSFLTTPPGMFVAVVQVPEWAIPGSVSRITARDPAGVLLATTTLMVGPAGTVPATLVVPDQAAPGSTVAVSGAAFTPGDHGDLTINGLVVSSFDAAPDGSFIESVTIPEATRLGRDRISAKDAAGRVLATTTLIVLPGATPSPTPTVEPTPTLEPTPTFEPSPSVGPTIEPSPGPTATPEPSATATPLPSLTPLPSPTPEPSPTATPPSPAPSASPPASGLPNFDHIYVIVMENHEYSSVIGSPQAPFINSLIARYGLATNFYAEGHPSQLNYIAMTSGGTQGITGDGNYDLATDNVFAQVAASGRTWKAYQQGYPGGCFSGSSAGPVADGVGLPGTYVRRHNPAISYTGISGDATACSNITNLASFDPAAANLEFITPNLANDMHDGTLAGGDNFLKAFVPLITGSPAFANSVIFLTFDEGTSNLNGGGRVVTIAITPGMTGGYKATDVYTHYSMLATIEQAWGLPTLGNAASAPPMAFPYNGG